MIVFSRSSNCPRYFVPATIKDKSKEKNPLVRQKRRNIPIRNSLRQPFHDRRLANSRFADQQPDCSLSGGTKSESRVSTSPSRPTRGSSDPSVAACVKSRLNSASSEVSFGREAVVFSPVVREQLFPAAPTAEARVPSGSPPQSTSLRAGFRAAGALCRRACGPGPLSASSSFRRHVQDALAFPRSTALPPKWKCALADGDTGFNFFSDGFDRALLPQESICQRFGPRASSRATNAPSRCTDSHTGWLRTGQKR